MVHLLHLHTLCLGRLLSRHPHHDGHLVPVQRPFLPLRLPRRPAVVGAERQSVPLGLDYLPHRCPHRIRRLYRIRQPQPGRQTVVHPARRIRVYVRRRHEDGAHGVHGLDVVSTADFQLLQARRLLVAAVAWRRGLPMGGPPLRRAGRVVEHAVEQMDHGRLQRVLHLAVPELPPAVHRGTFVRGVVRGDEGNALSERGRSAAIEYHRWGGVHSLCVILLSGDRGRQSTMQLPKEEEGMDLQSRHGIWRLCRRSQEHQFSNLAERI